jgi:hypothetical protein
MRVRFLKPLRVYRRGDVVDLGDGEANVLIAREIVQAGRTQSTMFEAAAVEHETRTAAVKRTRKRRVTECDTEA